MLEFLTGFGILSIFGALLVLYVVHQDMIDEIIVAIGSVIAILVLISIGICFCFGLGKLILS